ncbi:MAG: ABC transporter ATP-binding protein [Candidatus Riflebacteria bacterium]|nr:ABC transporter ATP-binding protein [Candidatus Riflebacteria bacterium]
MSDHALLLDQVSIKFPIRSWERSFGKNFKQLLSKNTQIKDHFTALDKISLKILSGERVGIIGLNGAGKTTLLKTMAGIYPPFSGSVSIKGHVCPLLEFVTGFEMNLTGWDNIRIRGMLLGMNLEEIEEKISDIADFSELGEFLDLPVRTYSSGMFIRLAFSVSTSINPELLLIDEVFAAGDVNFAAKAKKRMFDFISQGKLLVFASHDIQLVESLCDRVIWIDKGHLMEDGNPKDVLSSYLRYQQKLFQN